MLILNIQNPLSQIMIKIVSIHIYHGVLLKWQFVQIPNALSSPNNTINLNIKIKVTASRLKISFKT